MSGVCADDGDSESSSRKPSVHDTDVKITGNSTV